MKALSYEANACCIQTLHVFVLHPMYWAFGCVLVAGARLIAACPCMRIEVQVLVVYSPVLGAATQQYGACSVFFESYEHCI